jgi:adenylate cyclase
VKPLRLYVLLLLLCAVLLAAWVAVGSSTRLLDARFHDQLTRVLPVDNVPGNVVLVDIDEASLAELGPWPWPRPLLAQIAQRLRERGARLQIWDVFLPDPAQGDELLDLTLGPSGRQAGLGSGTAGAPLVADVVIGQVLILDPQVQSPPRHGSLRPSPIDRGICTPELQVSGYFGVADSLPTVRAGHIAATPDHDGALRRLPAVVCTAGGAFPQLTLVAGELLEPEASWQIAGGGLVLGPAHWLVRGGLRFALDDEYQLKVPYRHPHTHWPAISVLKVLEDSPGPIRPSSFRSGGDRSVSSKSQSPAVPSLEGKVVVLGATALGLADTVSTPFHATAPGVSVHAELIAAALGGRWSITVNQPGFYVAFTVGCLGLLMAFLLPLLRGSWALGAAVLLACGIPAVIAVAARTHDIQLPVAAPSLGVLLFALGWGALQIEDARRQARVLVHHLESFLPRSLAREIARQSPSSDSLGRQETGLVLALRVVGLERWSAAADALKALGLVHAISSLAEKHARVHGGTLQHLQGDTLLLVWVVPKSEPAPLRQAVEGAVNAAQGLFEELGGLLRNMESERYPLGLRASVETGAYLLAVAGTSATRRSLMLGPAVDVALALLPLCDELASPLLLGQRAASTQPGFSLKAMGSFLLPDNGQGQTIYRVES